VLKFLRSAPGDPSLGRGALYLLAGKFASMLAGYGIILFLTRTLGDDPTAYGVYSTVVTAVSILNMVVITGTIQAVSKFVSERPSESRSVVAGAIRVQGVLLLLLTGGYLAAAPFIARLLNDPGLTPYLRISALILGSYTIYAAFIGAFNGLRNFRAQGLFDAFFALLKAAAVCGAVALGFGAAGALWGFGGAALTITALAAAAVGIPRGVVPHPPGRIARFAGSVILFVFLQEAIKGADILLLKALGGDASRGSALAGYYYNALNVARVPMYLLTAVIFVIFPVISRVTFVEDRERTRFYIRGVLRYTLIILTPFCVLVSLEAEGVTRLLFGPAFDACAEPLRLLAVGQGFFAVAMVATTVITAGGRPGASVLFALAALATQGALNFTLIPRQETWGAALGTTTAMALWAVLCLGFLGLTYSAGLPVRSTVRILACGAAVGAGALAVGPASGGWAVLAKLCGFGALFVALLALTRELTREDWNRVLGIVRPAR
jgi:O-antigen/teichoic acid export membrane protein